MLMGRLNENMSLRSYPLTFAVLFEILFLFLELRNPFVIFQNHTVKDIGLLKHLDLSFEEYIHI